MAASGELLFFSNTRAAAIAAGRSTRGGTDDIAEDMGDTERRAPRKTLQGERYSAPEAESL